MQVASLLRCDIAHTITVLYRPQSGCLMGKPRQVAGSVPIVLPWLLSPVELAALEIPANLASTASDPENRSPLFLLCSSRKHPKKFLFSKGGIEEDEDAEAAAVREGWVSTASSPVEGARH